MNLTALVHRTGLVPAVAAAGSGATCPGIAGVTVGDAIGIGAIIVHMFQKIWRSIVSNRMKEGFTNLEPGPILGRAHVVNSLNMTQEGIGRGVHALWVRDFPATRDKKL